MRARLVRANVPPLVVVIVVLVFRGNRVKAVEVRATIQDGKRCGTVINGVLKMWKGAGACELVLT